MLVGKAPENQFSESYQSGPLSFEFSYLNDKIDNKFRIFSKIDHQLELY